jgi:hypothetical protein
VQLVLEMDDGRRFEFDETLRNLKELRERVEERTLPFLLPPAREAVQGGANLGFGPLSVSRAGLHHRDATLDWPSFADVEVARGEVIVRAVDAGRPFCKVALSETPNAHLLQALARELAGRRP